MANQRPAEGRTVCIGWLCASSMNKSHLEVPTQCLGNPIKSLDGDVLGTTLNP
jgi:hypothetical protein